jgi:hypothetical protein
LISDKNLEFEKDVKDLLLLGDNLDNDETNFIEK